MEQSYKEKYEDILARLERAKNDDEVCDERFCCVIDDLIPELAENKDERIRKAIKEALSSKQAEDIIESKYKIKMIDVSDWLEKQNEKLPAGFYYVNSEGKKFYSEKFKYGNVVLGISANNGKDEQEQEWSEEDEKMFDSVIGDILSADTLLGGKETASCKIDWLKSLKERIGGKI